MSFKQLLFLLFSVKLISCSKTYLDDEFVNDSKSKIGRAYRYVPKKGSDKYRGNPLPYKKNMIKFRQRKYSNNFAKPLSPMRLTGRNPGGAQNLQSNEIMRKKGIRPLNPKEPYTGPGSTKQNSKFYSNSNTRGGRKNVRSYPNTNGVTGSTGKLKCCPENTSKINNLIMKLDNLDRNFMNKIIDLDQRYADLSLRVGKLEENSVRRNLPADLKSINSGRKVGLKRPSKKMIVPLKCTKIGGKGCFSTSAKNQEIPDPGDQEEILETTENNNTDDFVVPMKDSHPEAEGKSFLKSDPLLNSENLLFAKNKPSINKNEILASKFIGNLTEEQIKDLNFEDKSTKIKVQPAFIDLKNIIDAEAELLVKEEKENNIEYDYEYGEEEEEEEDFSRSDQKANFDEIDNGNGWNTIRVFDPEFRDDNA